MRSSGTGQAGTKSFSNEAYRSGDLKRRMTVDTLAYLNDTPGVGVSTGVFTFRRVLKGLNAGLSIHIACGAVGLDTNVPIPASFFPPLGATMQLTPVNLFPDAPPVWLRPIFQDPAIANNSNNPLAQDLPFGWEFETVADEIVIDVSVNADLLASLHLVGRIVVEVGLEYVGDWPFPEAVKYMLTQPQLVGSGSNIMTFDTSVA